MANAFWEFSLEVYAAAGVSDECLALQDGFGIDVNLLLFTAYMGRRAIVLSRADLVQAAALVQTWREHIIKPLRNARRATKQMPPHAATSDRVATFYEHIKTTELEAERIEQELLYDWSRSRANFLQSPDNEGAIRRNIQLLLEFFGAAESGAPEPAALIRACSTAKPPGEAC